MKCSPSHLCIRLREPYSSFAAESLIPSVMQSAVQVKSEFYTPQTRNFFDIEPVFILQPAQQH